MARLPDGALMQRAAAGLAYAVIDFLGAAYGARVLLLVGAGDNGGDALYAGALLARRGAQVEAWLLSDHAHRAGWSRCALPAGGRRRTCKARVDAQPSRRRYDVVVDGIVGHRRPARAAAGRGARSARLAGVPVVAVDIPCGVERRHRRARRAARRRRR